MPGPGAGAERSRGYVVFRQAEPGLWFLVGDVDYRPGLTARAERIRAVQDATGSAPADGEVYATLQRDQWHVVRGG
jgi:hypothetical protein